MHVCAIFLLSSESQKKKGEKLNRSSVANKFSCAAGSSKIFLFLENNKC